MQRNSTKQRPLAFLLMTAALTVLVGCGSGGDFPTGRVSGKVTYDGKPVPGGSITFTPIAKGTELPGSPGGANIGTDGSYTLSTYGTNDGAVVGKHRVSFSPPSDTQGKEFKPGETFTTPYDGLVPKTQEVEVKAGSNTIDIELVKPGM